MLSGTKDRGNKIIRSLVVGLLILLIVVVASVIAQVWTDAARRELAEEAARQLALAELKETLLRSHILNSEYQRTGNADLLLFLARTRGQAAAHRDELLTIAAADDTVLDHRRRMAELVDLQEAHLQQQVTLLETGRRALADSLQSAPEYRQRQQALFAAVTSMQQRTDTRAVELDEKVSRLNVLATILQVGGALGLLYVFLSIYRKLRPLIDDLYRSNERLEQQEETNQVLITNLRQTNVDLDHFAYIASHDLQEPLRTVSNFIEVFREEYGDRLDDQAEQYFGFLLRATDRMRDLINNLLNFSRIGQEEKREIVDLNEVVREVLEALAFRVEASATEIEVGQLPRVSGFRIELFQLFQNLISNAIKFTLPDTAPQISIYATRSDTYHRIAVEDQGIGIAEQDQHKIFRMFSRINSPTSYGGEGIGLAFCRKIVELHGGSLTVDSSPGRGSTFYISLPHTVENEPETSQNTAD